jgi:hypothetical protein
MKKRYEKGTRWIDLPYTTMEEAEIGLKDFTFHLSGKSL